MVSQEWKKRWANLKIWARDYTHLLSGLGLAFSVMLLVLSSLSFWYSSLLPQDFLESFTKTSGRLDFCSAGIGLILLIFAGYYFMDNMNNRRQFNKLYNISSKEKFIRNREKLEELAYFLSTTHEKMVQRKIKEMKLR
jgi:hypothetical protein